MENLCVSGFTPKRRHNLKVSNGVVLALLTVNVLLLIFLFKFKLGLADDGDKVLTDLFKSTAFRGSWSWFDKLNPLGAVLNGIISVLSFISLFCIGVQVIFTISYFSAPNFWKRVDELKKDQLSKDFFGAKDLISGGPGAIVSSRGIEAIVNLFFIFLPNIYQMSEMGDGRESYLNEDDSFTTWIIKTFPRKVLIIILLTAGFNGSLMQCYAMVADAGGVIVQRVADYNLDDVINNVLDSGNNYQFSLADDNSEKGSVLEDVCQEVYKMTISKSETKDTASRMKIGSAIENAVKSEITDANMLSAVTSNGATADSLTADDWKYIKLSMTTNTDSSTTPGSFTFCLSDYTDTGSWNTNYYVHVTPVLKKKAQLKDYINS